MELVTTKMVPGGKLNITKVLEDAGVAGLTQVEIGLGWDVNPSAGGAAFDADATVILTKDDGTTSQDNVCYFGQEQTKGAAAGVAIHSGDNLTGAGDGDDEVITVDLTKMPAELTKASVYVTIYDADARGQNFGMLNNAYVAMRDKVSGKEICRMDLDFDADTATSIRFGTLVNKNGSWYFAAEKVAIEGGIGGVIGTHVK